MSGNGVDPGLLQDFLTESSELLERLDGDMVKLERLAGDPASRELLDGIFRALHTIKGAASFLQLTALTKFAHAAEDALNQLRKGQVRVTPEIMDILLRSVDVLRGMLGEVAEGSPITEAPGGLMSELREVAVGGGGSHGGGEVGVGGGVSETARRPGERPIALAAEKAELIPFLVPDLEESGKKLGELIEELRDPAERKEAAAELIELADSLKKTAVFFAVEGLVGLAEVLGAAAGGLAGVREEMVGEVGVRLKAVRRLIERQAEALTRGAVLSWPLGTFGERLKLLAKGGVLEAEVAGKHGGDPGRVLELDGVQAAEAGGAGGGVSRSRGGEEAVSGGEKKAGPNGGAEGASRSSVGEQTIRVEVDRLEALLNLVGQLVLNKNRVLAMCRKLRDFKLPHEFSEDLMNAASELDSLTSELQVGVMRTRMQPLAKLFDRYPRVIRDIARMTQKEIDLEISGKETEVDKSVLELLADPLVHLLRNSADHGIEKPEAREGAGKRRTGTIRLSAEHQGSHVRVEIADDGKGLDRELLGRKAVERGLVTADQLAEMGEEEVFRFIFEPGFSTAEKVSDLSGRGVGMDVVRTNITKMNGTVNLRSVKGRGTTIEILIPLTVAIMPAMMVGVGGHLYAVPLTSILEIVRPEGSAVSTIKGQPVLRLRDSVLPLVDMRERLGETGPALSTRFAVVVGVGQQRAGLVVDRLIGQQEVVIKPLDDRHTSGGPFSGATIREDGNVSLILDVVQLMRQAPVLERAAA